MKLKSREDVFLSGFFSFLGDVLKAEIIDDCHAELVEACRFIKSQHPSTGSG